MGVFFCFRSKGSRAVLGWLAAAAGLVSSRLGGVGGLETDEVFRQDFLGMAAVGMVVFVAFSAGEKGSGRAAAGAGRRRRDGRGQGLRGVGGDGRGRQGSGCISGHWWGVGG